jgi:hypothetical protein
MRFSTAIFLKHKLLAAALGAAALTAGGSPVRAAERPKLALIVVVDQFLYDYATRFRSDYDAALARTWQDPISRAVASPADYFDFEYRRNRQEV